eukprot:TRINITY_DN13503_c2_g1_i5.p1 TRINITY_DN13503_c2_g1~~TRINITY_DN13503_c2_g1_i5.p1  ORF type:complete len:491 (-),score=38.56 TRINITY_DN13503_c2_g1_i5:748-2220(-)
MVTIETIDENTSEDGVDLTKLKSELPANLLRGVPSYSALEGYGRHWSGIAGGPDDFFLSRATNTIDDFISHDWHTPRIVKYVTLSYIYNSRAAAVGSTLLATCFVFMRELLRFHGKLSSPGSRGVLPSDAICCATIGPFAYLALFFNWQFVSRRLFRGTMMFVDKLCIAQHDDDMKIQGILGLAAFLKSSERLVVLWSPVYFSRLWCTYELAAWFRLGRAVSTVLFMPVQVPPVIFIGSLGYCACGIAYYIDVLLQQGSMGSLSTMQQIFLVLMFVSWVLFAHVLHLHADHVAGLQQELEGFCIKQTSCFCCTNNHKHPESGETLVCDREMVYSTLKQWVEEKGAIYADAHINAFNHQVRTTLRDHIHTELPEDTLFIRYSDMVYSCFPCVWLVIDLTTVRLHRDEFNIAHIAEGLCNTLFVVPLSMRFLISIMSLDHKKQAHPVLSSCIWGPVGFAGHVLLFASCRAELYVRAGVCRMRKVRPFFYKYL